MRALIPTTASTTYRNSTATICLQYDHTVPFRWSSTMYFDLHTLWYCQEESFERNEFSVRITVHGVDWIHSFSGPYA